MWKRSKANAGEQTMDPSAEALIELVDAGHDVLIGRRGDQYVVRTLEPRAYPEFAWHYASARNMFSAIIAAVKGEWW